MEYIVNLTWVLLGIILYKLFSFKKNNSSNGFNITFWIRDNWRDITINLILSILIVRFYDEIIVLLSTLIPLEKIEILKKIKSIEFSFFVMGYFHQTLLHYLRHTRLKSILVQKKEDEN